jgi:DNA helicase II / ATP-dependent DNA helicase PcrA
MLSCYVQAAFIVHELKRRYSVSKSWKDFAVLFRTNATGQEFQQALRDSNIPFAVQGENFYSPMEIDDVLSLLRIAIYDDNRAFLSIAKLIRASIPQHV